MMETVSDGNDDEVRAASLPGTGDHVVRGGQRVLFAVPVDRSGAVAVDATSGQDYDAADEIATFGAANTLVYDDALRGYLEGAAPGLHVWEGSLDNRGFWFESDSGPRPIMLWRGIARVARLADLHGFAGLISRIQP